jgi:hypothetical protein
MKRLQNLKENKMLGLVAEINKMTEIEGTESRQTTISIPDIVKDLSHAKKQAQQIGEDEIYYLTSIALEAAREKMFLQLYETR